MEKVQERGLRTYMYCDPLVRAKLSLLHVQRLQQVLLEVCKIVHNEIPLYLRSMFKVKNRQYACRRDNVLEQTKHNTVEYGFKSFKYQGQSYGMILEGF